MQLIVNNRILDLSVPRVMGILNVTPDSFFDGGKYNSIDLAIDRAAKMIADGATIIDIGGESTRPGAHTISNEEEAERVIPIVMALKKRFDILMSVDTSKAMIIRECAMAGVHFINDIRALSEPGALEAAASSQLLICLMHINGEPRTMQKSPYYRDVLGEVKDFFQKKIIRCEKAGIEKSRLLIDPGFGFGKKLSHNYRLLGKLSSFHHFNLPLLVGMSRKSMIGQVINMPPKECMVGSIACAVIAAMQNIQIIRVHDVKPTVEALRVVASTISERKKYFI